ncbi:MAG TPA: acyl-CoA dehydrogenase family protein [Thermoanaerobaculia bacterium]|nr:acyl-CoA dehydrogenase family protein [Thermoanaerobaculia bacterium]
MIEQSFPAPTPVYTEARQFAEKHLAVPDQKEGEFSRESWDRLARFGFFHMPFPEELGGAGLAVDDLCDVLEGLGAGGPDNALYFSASAHLWAVVKPVVDFGTEEQKAAYLAKLMDGALIGAHAASEPGAGSDVMAMTTRYRKVDGGFVLSGSKVYVTNAPVADLFVAFATSDPRLHFRGISAFLIERGNPGLSVGPNEEKMGLKGSPIGGVFFDECFVPTSALLGKERQGARIFQTSLAWERTFIQAHQVGAMRRQVERAVAHALERQQFGVPIGKFQAVSHRIVDMYVRYWQSRLVLRMAASELALRGNTQFAALSKLVLGEGALATHLEALRTFGGSGYMVEMGLEKEVRDSLGGTLYSGTSDLQKNIIAASLGL